MKISSVEKQNMQEQMGNIREVETLRKNQKKMLQIKSTVTGMKNAFDRLPFNRVDIAKESLCELRRQFSRFH